MKDIKVLDTLNKIKEDQDWWSQPHSNIVFFAEAVALMRMEKTGVSFEDIAKCFKAQFSKEELESLINQLNLK